MDNGAYSARDPQRPKGGPFRVLIVEDEFLIANDISESMAALRLEVVGIAVSGADAIFMARKFRPDLVLMDIQLRGAMDGIDAGRIIGQELAIPIFVMSGSIGVVNRARIASMPTCKAVIEKPFAVRTLVDHVRAQLNSDRSP